MITVSSLVIYPIKGCSGIPLEESMIVPGGLQYDRRYMLVDESGRMITRREEVRLAGVRVRAQGDGFLVDAEGALTECAIENDASKRPDARAEEISASVWRDAPRSLVHEQGSAWFSTLLDRTVRLVYLPEENLRQVNPERADPGDVVSFADGYPLLLTSTSSLDELNGRLDVPLGMERFRPNVVVTGAEAFAEDCWAGLSLGDIHCAAPKLCDRCVVTTIEEGTGRKGREPLKTLASFRRWGGAVWFGTNVIPKGEGLLKKGDPVTISSTRAHPSSVDS